MSNCPTCGASVAATMTWCGQCYAPLAPESAEPAPSLRGPRPAEEPHAATYSRWRGGPTSFGPAGRTLLSVALLIGLVVGYPLTRGLIFATVGIDVPGMGLLALYICAAIPVGAYAVTRIWRRARIT